MIRFFSNPQSQLVVRAFTGGLRADFDKHFARHASASYHFERTYAQCKHARWLLDMHTNHHGFLAKSETYAAVALYSRIRKITVQFDIHE